MNDLVHVSFFFSVRRPHKSLIALIFFLFIDRIINTHVKLTYEFIYMYIFNVMAHIM